MNVLLIFIAGIVFVAVILPILDGFLQCISGLFEWFTSWISVHIMINNVQVQDMKDSLQINNTQAIGFEAPPEISEFDYEEEPDEDKLNSINKNKVGF